MGKSFKKVLFWVLAFLITIGTAVYQRMTGPTYPKDFKLEHEGEEFRFDLPRSQNGYTDALIELDIPDKTIGGRIIYHRLNTGETPDTISMHRENEELIAWLPKQPAAGKLVYDLVLESARGEVIFKTEESVIIRFKDEVPAFVLIPHIILIFAAMMLSNLTGLYAISGFSSFRFYALLTLLFFLAGGMIMGPVVQKYAFGEYWTGFPLGKDLTDNKALVAFIFWIIAWIGNRKKSRPGLAILAASVNLIISFIPHSLMGSELDYTSGEITTGMILHFLP